MFVRDLFEAQARRIVAIMPGGFHPFHPGHKSLYDWATKTFGSENVFVAATADTKTRPFPFDVKKKLANMAGVPAERFIQVKSPFNLNSYKDMLGDDAAIVFVRSLKDKGEQPLPDQTKKNGEPGYLRSYKGKNLRTSDEMGYMAYGPTIDFNFSGLQIKSASELRATWPEMSDEDKLKAAKLMYGNGAPVAVKLLNQALGDTEAPAEESINELFGLGNDNTSIKSQDPNKIKVLSWIADRADGKEHFLSFYRKGAAWSGKLIYVKPDEAKKFISKFDNNPKYQDRMKRALTSVQNASKLFNNIGIKHSIRMADNVNEQQVNEIAPAVLWAGAKAAGWVLGWAARRGAVPVVKWAIRRHGGKIAIGGTAAYYAKKGWDWVESILGPEMVKFLVANKFSIMMAVILILGGVALQKFFTKKGDELVQKMADESIDISEDASPDEEDEFHRKLDKLVHKYFGHSSDEKPKKTKPKKKITEGYKLTLERDGDLMILHILDTASGKRTEVRGKSGYESGNYDPTDKLHQLLDKLGKSVDISQLINGEPVGINPKHPHGAKAKAATDVAYNESTDLDSLKKFVRSQREAPDQVLYQMMMAPDTYGHSASNFVRSWYEKTKEENGLNDVDSALEIMVDQLGMKNEGAEITMWTNPKYQGADVDDKYYKKQPVKRVDVSKLTPFEPADKIDPKDNHDNMMKFVKKIKAGEKIKPIVIVPHEGKWLIVDGHHRYFAHLKAGADKIRVVVADPKNVTWRDDVPESVKENFDGRGHGTDIPLGKYLYHVTYAEALEGMLKDGHLNTKGPAPFHYADYFSMTADPKYSVSGKPEVQIIIDTARVSKMETFEKYVDDWESTPGAGDWAKGDDGDFESEYRVEETIPWNYVVAVKILKSKATPEIIELAKKRGVKLVGKDTNVLENFADGKTKAAIDKYQQTNTVGKTSRAFTDIEDEYLNIRELATKLIKNGLDAYTAYYKASEKMQFNPAMVFDWMGSEFKDEELEDFIPVEYERDWIKRAELGMSENFADGKKKGKSRPGRVKRSGASCNGSVTALRKRAKNASGEKAKMYHWCANMKSGKKK